MDKRETKISKWSVKLNNNKHTQICIYLRRNKKKSADFNYNQLKKIDAFRVHEHLLRWWACFKMREYVQKTAN